MKKTPALIAAGIAAVGLSACGSSGTSQTTAAQAVAQTTTAASSSAPAAPSSSSSSTAAAPAAKTSQVTKPGSTLKLGQTAVVDFGTTLKNGKDGPNYRFAITVESITPGSMSDFKGVSLTGVPKGALPYYVKLRMTNVGTRALKTGLGDPAYSLGAVGSDGIDGDLSLIGDFPPCPQVDTPSPFAPGQTFHTCQVFMERDKVTQVGYDGSESTIGTPIVWSAS